MELSTHQYLTFLRTNQVLGSEFRQLRLEKICSSQFAWVIASHLNLFEGPVLFKDGLNLDGMPLKITGFCKQCLDKIVCTIKVNVFHSHLSDKEVLG